MTMPPPQGRTAWEVAALLDIILGKDTARARRYQAERAERKRA